MSENDTSVIDTDKFSFPLAHSIRTFSENLLALRDFIKLVGSLLNERQAAFMRDRRKDFFPILAALPEEKRREMPADDFEKLKREFGADVTVEVSQEGERYHLKIGDVAAGKRLIEAIKGVQTDTKHRALLYRSALISLVSAAEWFLSQVIREYFNRYPDAIGKKEKSLSLDDLRSFGSIADAEKYLVDVRVDDIMRSNFDDWLAFLRASLKLSATYLDPNRNAISEIFQRRHVMVHNGGLADSVYMQKVPHELREGAQVGKAIEVPPEYLARAIDLIETNFILIGAELWKKLAAADNERATLLIHVAFERLRTENWGVAEGLSFFVNKDKGQSERDQLVGLLNYWQALKWQGRFEDVRQEVKEMDFSAKDELFQLARHALLDDRENFFRLLPGVLGGEKLSSEHLTTCPIFREMRKATEFAAFVVPPTEPSSSGLQSPGTAQE
jgi:hypothetical protein